MYQLWSTREEQEQYVGGTLKMRRIITPEQALLDELQDLRANGRSVSAHADMSTVLREQPALTLEYSNYLIAMAEVAQRGKHIPMNQLRAACQRQHHLTARPTVRERSVRVIPEQCLERMGRPALTEYQGRSIETNVAARRDLEIALDRNSRLTKRQRRAVLLHYDGYSRTEIAQFLRISAQELDRDLRQLAADRAGARIQRFLKTYRAGVLPGQESGTLRDLIDF